MEKIPQNLLREMQLLIQENDQLRAKVNQLEYLLSRYQSPKPQIKINYTPAQSEKKP